MSCLRSFGFGTAFGKKEVPETVWRLFLEMKDKPNMSVEYTYEIVKAGMLGRINLNSTFNLQGYCKAISENTRLVDYSNAKKVLHLSTDITSDNEGEKREYGTVSINNASMLLRMEDMFETVLKSDELAYAIKQIKELNNEFILDEGINVIEVLKNAVRGIPSAVDKLKYLCQNFDDLSEYVKEVLSSGIEIAECFQ